MFPLLLNAAPEEPLPEPDTTAVMAERTHPIMGGQGVTLFIENHPKKRRAILDISSNFLERPAELVRLGHFESRDLYNMERHRVHMIGMARHMKTEEQPINNAPPFKNGDTIVSAGGFDLDAYSVYREDALTLLSEAWHLSPWKPIDAVIVYKKKGSANVILRYRGKRELRVSKTTEELKCISVSNKTILCRIPKYGSVYLLK